MGVSRVGKMSQREVGAGVGGQGGTREEAECWTAPGLLLSCFPPLRPEVPVCRRHCSVM